MHSLVYVYHRDLRDRIVTLLDEMLEHTAFVSGVRDYFVQSVESLLSDIDRLEMPVIDPSLDEELERYIGGDDA